MPSNISKQKVIDRLLLIVQWFTWVKSDRKLRLLRHPHGTAVSICVRQTVLNRPACWICGLIQTCQKWPEGATLVGNICLSPGPSATSNFPSFGTQMEEVATGHISVPKGQGTLLFHTLQGVGVGIFMQPWRVWRFSSWLGQNRGSEGNSDMWAKFLLCGLIPSLCPSLYTPIYQSELPRAVLIRANIPDARTCPQHG